MSLMKTLAKVAIGVAIAKGVGGMMKKGQAAPSGGGAGGGLLDSLTKGAGGQGGAGGSLQDMLGGVLGGKTQTGAPTGGATGGGLGGLLEQLGKGGQGGAGGGLGDILGQLGKGGAGGGLGDLLGSLAGGAAAGGAAGKATGGGDLGDLLGNLTGNKAPKPAASGSDGSFGNMLNDAIANQGEPAVEPSAEQEAVAGLLLRAMIQAAKCDGELDQGEREKLMQHLADATPEEQRFVQQELQSPVDVKGLVRQIPQGLEEQVYAMSVMAIDLDSQAEAKYLDSLATELDLPHADVNGIHDKLGVQRLYA